MSHPSILFEKAVDLAALPGKAPRYFRDLNLDVVVSAITSGKDEYELKPFFFSLLKTVEAITFRQAVMRELESSEVMHPLKAFAKRMRAVREAIAWMGKRHHHLQKMRWFVDLVLRYADMITTLDTDLDQLNIESSGLVAMRGYVAAYATSPGFRALVREARGIVTELGAIRYDIEIHGLQIEVRPYDEKFDYGAQITALFRRFGDEEANEYQFDLAHYEDINSIEARILELVAQTHPMPFARLATFCEKNVDFLDGTMLRFDRELQFYVSYLDHVATLREQGLAFCYPAVSMNDKDVAAHDTFDLALAGKLAQEEKVPVTNDFHLVGIERVIVVTGPNQGGKTTFARCFAQLHYLAALGCLVPGTEARLFVPDHVFTHFERAEHMTNLTGKLQDDLIRIRDILQEATPRSLVVINEIFASTSLSDAIALSRKIATAIAELDLLCVWVTFIDEIADLNVKTISMVSMVDPADAGRRTFKIERKPANSLAYALSLARKYELAHEQIIARITS